MAKPNFKIFELLSNERIAGKLSIVIRHAYSGCPCKLIKKSLSGRTGLAPIVCLLLILSLFFSQIGVVYATTFTPGMGKRNVAGAPFAAGVMAQGD